jgi:hypothetical protein
MGHLWHVPGTVVSESNIAFDETQLARRFSFEMGLAPILAGARTFGFDEVFNLLLVMSDDDLRMLGSQFSDAIAISEMTRPPAERSIGRQALRNSRRTRSANTGSQSENARAAQASSWSAGP